MKKNVPAILNAWCMYDWANSVHALVIVSSIFPIYFSNTAKNAQGGADVDFLGFTINNSALFSFSVSFAFLFIALINPILGAIADFSGKKKTFMQGFVYLGAVSCAMLYFFDSAHLVFGVLVFTLSLIGWCGSLVFYNAYLPEIATENRYDKLSARGFTMGYLGSVLLLVFNLTMLLKPEWYGNISSGMACRVSFVLVAVWWIGFAQIPFYYLPKGQPSSKAGATNSNWIWNGFRELKHVLAELNHLPRTKQFLLAFFFYNMGVQTVMYIGTIFGSNELHLPDNALIMTILILQIVAILGAYLFAVLSGKMGNTNTISIAILIWMGICLGAYFVQTESQFYVLAAGIGFVMGGVQSLSRSTYAKLLPENTPDTASYFSFYDFCDKMSTFLGTVIFGLITQWSGMRNSLLFLVVIFAVGLLILRRIPSQKIYRDQSAAAV
ncbi:MAG: MFS transporter [Cytophagia bacterium]|nr:MAG: MFS transporter [Cytophagales bacterium]TAG37753.1 MAG: MFS transporter [Cytophagia bacterium]TAG58361.1 MAG: MFS transporter [Runella slithyformis]TAG74164.1 MAG: MFS transporter [Runella slithyformis]TAG78936.1 MAG: MFS transporter [Cytophagales bacterium]